MNLQIEDRKDDMRRLLTVFLLAALGIFISENALAVDQAKGVAETTWSGKDIWGKPITLYFSGDGSLTYKTSNGIWTNASWSQDDSGLYFEMNKKFVENKGVIRGDEMTGEGWTKQGYRSTWSATKQPSGLEALIQAKASAPLQLVPAASLSPTEYLGTYEGKVAFNTSSMTIRLRCGPESNCEMETINSNGDTKPFSRIDQVKHVGPVSNWLGVQRAFQYARINRADRPTAIPEELMPLLNSSAVIDKCIDLNLGGSDASLICRSSVSPWKEPVLIFFGASLAPCGQGFCEYAVYPLFKK